MASTAQLALQLVLPVSLAIGVLAAFRPLVWLEPTSLELGLHWLLSVPIAQLEPILQVLELILYQLVKPVRLDTIV